jgi:hypothetical protein
MKSGSVVVALKYALHAHSQLSSFGQTYFIAPPMQGIQQVGMEDIYWITSGWLRGGALGREVAEGGTGKGSCADTMAARSAVALASMVKDFILGKDWLRKN